MRCTAKDLEKNSQSNRAVTSVTTTPKVCKCNEIDICIKTTFCYIQIHRQIVFLMQFKILIKWPFSVHFLAYKCEINLMFLMHSIPFTFDILI